GTWPLVWDSQVKSPSAQKFTDAFTKKYGKPPENQAWGVYLSTKHVAQAMNELKTTDSTKIVEYLEKGARFDVLKTREGYYRNWDHQLLGEMYTIRFKPASEVKSQWDLFTLSAPVTAASESLEVLGGRVRRHVRVWARAGRVGGARRAAGPGHRALSVPAVLSGGSCAWIAVDVRVGDDRRASVATDLRRRFDPVLDS